MAFSTGYSASLPSSEINVTPLIDVLLVLLIIFMVIVPVTPRGLSSQIPQLRAAASDEGPVSVRVVAGRAAGELRYELDGRTIARTELAAGMRQRLAMLPGRGVFVAASPQVEYQTVVEIVAEAKSAGAVSVGLGRL
jgi:biopolymer transport protein ExbD